MIAVTIGVGAYKSLAGYAADAVCKFTGLETKILDETDFRNSQLPSPHFLKLKIFDFIPDDDVLYFDADMVCLHPWDPKRFGKRSEIVGVVERPHSCISAACEMWGLPVEEYLNTGLLILNRRHHSKWLLATEEFIRTTPPMALYDQTPLNITRRSLGLGLHLLDRRYNWIGFGIGTLCYKVPIFMAHTLRPPSKEGNIEFFEGRYVPPFNWSLPINDNEMAKLGGKHVILNDRGVGELELRRDGTTSGCRSLPDIHYWFVYDHNGSSILTLASQTEIVSEFLKVTDHHWTSEQRSSSVIVISD